MTLLKDIFWKEIVSCPFCDVEVDLDLLRPRKYVLCCIVNSVNNIMKAELSSDYLHTQVRVCQCET